MHTITSLKKLIKEVIDKTPSQLVNKRGYNKSIKELDHLRKCVAILEAGITEDDLLITREKLTSKIEACTKRINNTTASYRAINKQVPSKIIRAIKNDFDYSLSLNQIKTINFILNEKSVQ